MENVIGILPDTATHKNRRLVRSQISTGVWECSCRGWTTHRKCKHIPTEPAREHWMCLDCQRAHHGSDVGFTPLHQSQEGLCCWCGKKKTARLAPSSANLPCHDVHLEDVS